MEGLFVPARGAPTTVRYRALKSSSSPINAQPRPFGYPSLHAIRSSELPPWRRRRVRGKFR